MEMLLLAPLSLAHQLSQQFVELIKGLIGQILRQLQTGRQPTVRDAILL
ncbi:MAG: hypothetical protein NVS4B11_11580 [Ktedonobacteraceae bacterium]